MYTLINGSPKTHSSNSLYFLNIIKNKLIKYKLYELKKHVYCEILNGISLSQVIVLAFPLYVDSPASIVLKFFDYIIDNKISLSGKKIYIIINCGFREGEQNITGLNVIKRWCEKTGCTYGGAILIGAGEIIGNQKYKFISKTALKKLNAFAHYIKNKKSCSDIVTTTNFINNNLFCCLANSFWTKKGKKNKIKKEDILIK